MYDRQRGSALLMVTALGLALTGFMALVADTGVLALEKSRLQSAADAAALAGALSLSGGTAAAAEKARAYVAANGLAPECATVDFPAADTVRVALAASTPAMLPVLVGADDHPVVAEAAARAETIETGGARPFAVPETQFVAGADYILKAGPRSGQQGNFRAVAIDGTGAQVYVQTILRGAAADVAVGSWLSTEPGNMAGPTDAAIDELIATTSAAVGRVLIDDPGCSADHVCDPLNCRRIVVALLVDPLTFHDADGRSPVQVTGFARFYLVGTNADGEVVGRFLRRLESDVLPGRRYKTISRLTL
ncbi:MAG: hypothetical protein FJZ01_13200 [Candidatus Sericytochromatia bacterium]|nr:hypothetical protein [Candidatus Tanganyikabacteria bacterium]